MRPVLCGIAALLAGHALAVVSPTPYGQQQDTGDGSALGETLYAANVARIDGSLFSGKVLPNCSGGVAQRTDAFLLVANDLSDSTWYVCDTPHGTWHAVPIGESGTGGISAAEARALIAAWAQAGTSATVPFAKLPRCTSGQVLKHDGTTWACAADDAGTGGGGLQASALRPFALTATSAATARQGLAALLNAATTTNQRLGSEAIARGAVGRNELDSDSVDASKIASGAVTNVKVATGAINARTLDASQTLPTCTNEQIVEWDTSLTPDGWACIEKPSGGTGSGDISAVNTPATGGLAGGRTSGAVSLTLRSCAAGQILKRNAGNTAWECAADGGGSANVRDFAKSAPTTTDTAARQGIATLMSAAATANERLPSAAIRDDAITRDKIDDDAVGASQLANNAVSTAKIASGAVTSSSIAYQTIEAQDIRPGAVGRSQLADNQKLPTTCADGETLEWDTSVTPDAYRCVTGGSGSGDITAVNTATGSGLMGGTTTGAADIALIDCDADQVLQRNTADTAWECADAASGGGSGDITAVNTPAAGGLTGGQTSGAATLQVRDCAAGQVLKRNTADTAWECAVDAIGGAGTTATISRTTDNVYRASSSAPPGIAAGGYDQENLLPAGTSRTVPTPVGNQNVWVASRTLLYLQTGVTSTFARATSFGRWQHYTQIPTVTAQIAVPAAAVAANTEFNAVLTIGGTATGTSTITWGVNTGTIVSGQGTTTLRVRTPNIDRPGVLFVTATVVRQNSRTVATMPVNTLAAARTFTAVWNAGSPTANSVVRAPVTRGVTIGGTATGSFVVWLGFPSVTDYRYQQGLGQDTTFTPQSVSAIVGSTRNYSIDTYIRGYAYRGNDYVILPPRRFTWISGTEVNTNVLDFDITGAATDVVETGVETTFNIANITGSATGNVFRAWYINSSYSGTTAGSDCSTSNSSTCTLTWPVQTPYRRYVLIGARVHRGGSQRNVVRQLQINRPNLTNVDWELVIPSRVQVGRSAWQVYAYMKPPTVDAFQRSPVVYATASPPLSTNGIRYTNVGGSMGLSLGYSNSAPPSLGTTRTNMTFIVELGSRRLFKTAVVDVVYGNFGGIRPQPTTTRHISRGTTLVGTSGLYITTNRAGDEVSWSVDGPHTVRPNTTHSSCRATGSTYCADLIAPNAAGVSVVTATVRALNDYGEVKFLVYTS